MDFTGKCVLVTGGSGLARFLPEAYRRQGLLQPQSYTAQLPKIPGRAAILSGSCSQATNRQVFRQLSKGPSYALDVAALMADSDRITKVSSLPAKASKVS